MSCTRVCRSLGVLILAALLGAGCAAVKDAAGGATNLKDKVKDTEKAVEDSDPTELSGPGKSKYMVMEGIMERCPVDSTPFEWSDYPGNAIDDCETKSERATKEVERFPKEDIGKPKYVESKEYAETLAAKIPEWQAEYEERQEARQANLELAEAYEEEVRKHDKVLSPLYKFQQDDSPYLRGPDELLGMAEGAEEMGPLADGCENKGWDEAPTNYSGARAPENACPIALNWQETFEAYAESMIERQVEKEAKDMRFRVKELREDGKMHFHYRKNLEGGDALAEKTHQEWASVYEKIGAEVIADHFQPLAEAAAEYPEAMAETSKVNRWPEEAKHSDGEMKTALKDAVEGADLTFVKYGLTHPDWGIKTHPNTGVPTHRLRDAAVLTRAEGESACRIYYLTGKSQYDGTGYTKPVVELDHKRHGYIVSSCK